MLEVASDSRTRRAGHALTFGVLRWFALAKIFTNRKQLTFPNVMLSGMVPMLERDKEDALTGTYSVRPTTPDVRLSIDPHFPEKHHSIDLIGLAACLP